MSKQKEERLTSIAQKVEQISSSERTSMGTVNYQQMKLLQAPKFVTVNKVFQALKVNKAMKESMANMGMEVLLISQPYHQEYLVHLEEYKFNLEST